MIYFSPLTWLSWGRPDQYSAGRGSEITPVFHPRLWNFITLPGSNQDGIQMGQALFHGPQTFQSQWGSSPHAGDLEGP